MSAQYVKCHISLQYSPKIPLKSIFSHWKFIVGAYDTARLALNPAARLSEISLIFAATHLKQNAKRNAYCWIANLLINCNP